VIMGLRKGPSLPVAQSDDPIKNPLGTGGF
jgi:hypothetical protein